MGNNTSQVRKSSITYNESNVRKSTSQKPSHHNLDDEFSDLILHEVKKDDIKNKNLFNKDSLSNKFSNDLIEDEFNELNDLIGTDEPELSRNIIPKDNEIDTVDTSMDTIEDNDSTFIGNDDMDIDLEDTAVTTAATGTPESGKEEPVSDLTSVDFTKIISDANSLVPSKSVQVQQVQPIQQFPVPDRRPPSIQGSAQSQGSTSATQVQGQVQGIQRSSSMIQSTSASSSTGKLVTVEIKWVNVLKENIQKIAIIGSFSNWRNIIRLKPSNNHPNEYVVTIRLPLGVHKLLYIINNEYRVSEQLPTATDQEGIFFNWFEVLDGSHLFNHSQNQPNRTNASTKYDANIIQSAGQFEINEIKKKSNSFLTKISKEEPNFEHVEYMDNDEDDDMQKEMNRELLEAQQQQQQQHHPHHIPHQDEDQFLEGSSSSVQYPSSQENGPYISMSDNNSTSFLLNESLQNPVQYSSEIPEIFVDYNYFKTNNKNFELPEPPQLPAHLNNVLLNKLSNQNNSQSQLNAHPHHQHQHHGHHESSPLPSLDSFKPPSASFATDSSSRRPPLRRADSSYYASNQEAYHLSIPNHVILNHLMTTSIRNDVLTVACITRYSGKFVTQIMHSPADSM